MDRHAVYLLPSTEQVAKAAAGAGASCMYVRTVVFWVWVCVCVGRQGRWAEEAGEDFGVLLHRVVYRTIRCRIILFIYLSPLFFSTLFLGVV